VWRAYRSTIWIREWPSIAASVTFEKHVSKLKGGKGFADAWKRGYFAWEYKGIFAADHGLPTVLPEMVHPSQFYGLELKTYAHELASVVVWIPVGSGQGIAG